MYTAYTLTLLVSAALLSAIVARLPGRIAQGIAAAASLALLTLLGVMLWPG